MMLWCSISISDILYCIFFFFFQHSLDNIAQCMYRRAKLLFLSSFWLFFLILSEVIAAAMVVLKLLYVEKNLCSLKRSAITDKNMQADQSWEPQKSVQITGGRMKAERSTVLVEEVVVHFDLGAGFEVVWKQHDRYRHLAQVINLRMINA